MKNSKRRFLVFCMLFSLSCSVFSAYPFWGWKRQPVPVASIRTNANVLNNVLFRKAFRAANIVAFCSIVTCVAVYLVKNWWSCHNRRNSGNVNPGNNNANNPVPPVRPEHQNPANVNQNDIVKRFTEQKQRKMAQLVAKGVNNVPDYMLPYVLDATRRGNVVYIQLDTINQFDRNVTAPVTQHRETLINQMLQEKKKLRFDDLDAADKERANDFSAGGTCPVQSIRNARLLAQFLRSENENQALDALRRINNAQDAREYLQDLTNNGKKTSWLETVEIYRRLEEEQLDHDVSLMDSVVMSEDQFEVEKFKLRFGSDGAFHIFIINTGDITALGEIDKARQRINQKRNLNLNRGQTLFLERHQEGRGHYYVAAIQRRGDDIFYYTTNTVRDEDHVNNPVFAYRDRYLCENMLNVNPRVNFRNYLRNYSEGLIEGYMQHGVIKVSAKQKKGQVKDIADKKAGRKRSNSL